MTYDDARDTVAMNSQFGHLLHPTVQSTGRSDVLTIRLGPKVPKRGRLRRPLQRRPLVQKNVKPDQRIGELPDRLQAVLTTETLQPTPELKCTVWGCLERGKNV